MLITIWKNCILFWHLDWTIFAGVIALFYLEYFIKIGRGRRYILYFCSKTQPLNTYILFQLVSHLRWGRKWNRLCQLVPQQRKARQNEGLIVLTPQIVHQNVSSQGKHQFSLISPKIIQYIDFCHFRNCCILGFSELL